MSLESKKLCARWFKLQDAWLRRGHPGFDSWKRAGGDFTSALRIQIDLETHSTSQTAERSASHATFLKCRGRLLGPSEHVVVVLGFTMLLTSQVISVAFYSEREKSDKFCSKALISA